MELEQLRLVVSDGVASVVFDRPPVNAQNRKTREELIQLFDALGDRDDVRAVILTGAREIFSAGADIKERVDMVARARRLRPPQPNCSRMFRRGNGLPQTGDRGSQWSRDRRRVRPDAVL